MRRDSSGCLELNRKLDELGFEIEINDTFNLTTDIAVRYIQEKCNLVKDGIVGPKTLAAISTFTASSYPPIRYWKIAYLSQRDNSNVPNGTCNVTSLATVMQFWGFTSSHQLEDELFLMLETEEAQTFFKKNFPSLQNYNARNVHGMLGWCARKHGLKWEYKALDPAFVREKAPVIISGKFTSFGHICVLLGFTYNGDWIVHDPYGDWNTDYKNKQGAYRVYNKEDCNRLVRKEVDYVYF
jgi:hypothetical protein